MVTRRSDGATPLNAHAFLPYLELIDSPYLRDSDSITTRQDPRTRLVSAISHVLRMSDSEDGTHVQDIREHMLKRISNMWFLLKVQGGLFQNSSISLAQKPNACNEMMYVRNDEIWVS